MAPPPVEIFEPKPVPEPEPVAAPVAPVVEETVVEPVGLAVERPLDLACGCPGAAASPHDGTGADARACGGKACRVGAGCRSPAPHDRAEEMAPAVAVPEPEPVVEAPPETTQSQIVEWMMSLSRCSSQGGRAGAPPPVVEELHTPYKSAEFEEVILTGEESNEELVSLLSRNPDHERVRQAVLRGYVDDVPGLLRYSANSRWNPRMSLITCSIWRAPTRIRAQ